MPIIKLPDALRDVVPSALGNELSRRIEKGDAVAILTCQSTESGGQQYLVEFKLTDNANTLASYRGHSNRADGTDPVPLCPYAADRAEGLAHDADIGHWGFALRRIPSDSAETHNFRVEWTLSETSAACLALEASAVDGQSVVMNRADCYPGK